MNLTTRRVRNLRRYIQANRCPKRPGLIHDWRIEYEVRDVTQLAPPAEEILRCYKCGKDQP